MKKILSVLFAVFFGVLFTACTAAPIVYEFDADKPWGKNEAYEKCVYDIKIVERVRSGKETTDGDILADGQAVYELTQYRDRESGELYVNLKLTHTVTFRDTDKAGADRGLTDTVESEVVFTTEGCGVISSYKKEVYAPRKTDGNFRNIVYDYEATADYNAYKACLKKNKSVAEDGTVSDEYESVKEFDLISGTQSFDNEQLYYVARALKNTAPKNSQILSLSNLYEIPDRMDKKGKYKNTNVTVQTAEELSVFTLNEAFAATYLSPAENGSYDVNCMRTTLMRNDTYSGPAFTLYMTEPSVKFERKEEGGGIASTTSKVIVRMVRVNYDLSAREEATNIVYSLSDYTTEK